ncbi:1-phosphofructokinase family hexose kinase [Dactylosporangium sp. CA-233914]|uniref:1-phosphofructokinase family hexose kinase n=1 Tax=Dactylosporangium sp. CA-233914 TaxID=3239934 RepID=UPI003D940A93
MILTVTLNPALDLTYAVDELRPHTTHRVRTVHERPGGKGLNVASVLHMLGEPVHATGLLGGATGARVRDLLAATGLPATFSPTAGETRRTVTITDGTDATGLWEPGPAATEPEWQDFLRLYRELLAGTTVVALSGSLPRGLPPDAYAVLIHSAREYGARTVLDTSGEPLRLGLTAGPDLAKPNAEELAALVGPRAARAAGADGPAAGADGPAAEADGRVATVAVARALAADGCGLVVSRGRRGCSRSATTRPGTRRRRPRVRKSHRRRRCLRGGAGPRAARPHAVARPARRRRGAVRRRGRRPRSRRRGRRPLPPAPPPNHRHAGPAPAGPAAATRTRAEPPETAPG